MPLQQYFTNQVDVSRTTDLLIAGATQSLDVRMEFDTDIVVELTPDTVTGSYVITGTRDGTTVVDTLSFASATLTTKVTSVYFDYLDTIEPSTGATDSFSARIKMRSGKPYPMVLNVASGVMCRIEPISVIRLGRGPIPSTPAGVIETDRYRCYLPTSMAYINPQDELIDVSDSSRYLVTEINKYYNSSVLHHIEASLIKQ